MSTMTREEYYGILLSPNEGLRLPRVFLFLMSSEEAVLFTELIQESGDAKSSLSKGQGWDGWFSYCTEDLKNKINCPAPVQLRIVKKLVELGLVESELRGFPSRRHFKINFKNLVSKIKNLEDY